MVKNNYFVVKVFSIHHTTCATWTLLLPKWFETYYIQLHLISSPTTLYLILSWYAQSFNPKRDTCLINEHSSTLFRGGLKTFYYRGGAILHTPTNFWTTNDTELKFYMVIDIHKLFRKIEKKIRLKVLTMHLWRHNYSNFNRF